MPDIDEALARLLLLDGRVSFSDLSRRLNVSRSVVAARVTELIGSGQLRVVAVVHPRVLGLNAIAHLSISLSGSTHNVVEELVKRESCVFVSLTTGPFAVTVEMRLPTMAGLEEEIECVRALPGVNAIDVLIYQEISRSFFLSAAPDLRRLDLDDIDLLIMNELQRDGRLGFGDLGERVGLSASAARARLMRLLEANVMQIGAIRRRDPHSPSIALGLGMRTAGDPTRVISHLGRLPGIEFIARCFGRFDLVATVAIESTLAASAVIDGIRGLDEMSFVEPWTHLEIVKEDYEKPLHDLATSARSDA